jgi:hypothetical protein
MGEATTMQRFKESFRWHQLPLNEHRDERMDVKAQIVEKAICCYSTTLITLFLLLKPLIILTWLLRMPKCSANSLMTA